MNRKLWLMTVCSLLLTMAASGQNPPAASTNADAAKAYIDKGRALSKDDKFEEALKAFQKASELQPDNEDAMKGQFGMCMELHRVDAGLKILDQWIELKPDDPRRWFFKAMAAGETGRPEESLKAFDRLIQLQPDEGVNWIGKGQCLAALNRNDEALQALDKATTLNPKLADAWGIKGYLQAKMKKYDEAIASCNKAIELSPPEHAGYRLYSRARVYALKGDKINALADLKQAIQMKPAFKTQAPKDEGFQNLYSDADFKKLTE